MKFKLTLTDIFLVPTETSKPPLQKRKSEAVLDILRKQESIRRNLDNRRSFCNTGSRNNKSSEKNKERRSFRQSQEKINNQKLSIKKSMASINSIENEPKPKPYAKLSRKEARAAIGLGDIPDDKIDEKVKLKKHKIKSEKQSVSKVNGGPVPKFQYQNPRPKLSNDQRVTMNIQNEIEKPKKVVVKETIKIKYPDEISPRKLNIVKAKIPECNYDQDMMDSLHDFDEFQPIYQDAKESKHDSKSIKTKYNSKGKEKNKKTPTAELEINELSEEERRAEIEAKKELVRQQRKAKLRKMKEDKEREIQEELRKKQNLEALQDKFKKRTENYKKKAAEAPQESDTSILSNEDHRGAAIARLTTKPNQSQDNFKIQHFTGHKLPLKHKTSKNSAVSSVAHSIQSPVNRQVYPVEAKRGSISDASTTVTQVQGLPGRRTFQKPKKIVKKVISIPTVKIDKKLAKQQKRGFMDIIPENMDQSEAENLSVMATEIPTQSAKTEQYRSELGRKVIISKINKPVKEHSLKSSKGKGEKSKSKKIKKNKKVKPTEDRTNQSINMQI